MLDDPVLPPDEQLRKVSGMMYLRNCLTEDAPSTTHHRRRTFDITSCRRQLHQAAVSHRRMQGTPDWRPPLDRIELDLAGVGRRQLSALLTGTVIPRPIAWVSSLDADGRLNLAPHSYFNVISNEPPIVYFQTSRVADAPDGMKDTLRNVRASEEFVINIPSQRHVRAMTATASRVLPDVDEAALAGVEMAPSTRVRPPRVADAAIALECRVSMILQLGGANVVLGEVVHVSIADGALRRPITDASELVAGDFDAAFIDPLVRLGGTGYATLGEFYEAPIPTPAELDAAGWPG
jgi:flavin reductase (DIM6/NTAB) family NADH-FMN oxidoreductase RutF